MGCSRTQKILIIIVVAIRALAKATGEKLMGNQMGLSCSPAPPPEQIGFESS
jgi:hypothetical protein